MKQFKKTEGGKFICEECGHLCGDKSALSRHIIKNHNTKKYFDKGLLDDNINKCIICNKETEFISISAGYKKFCSHECEYINRNNSIKDTYKNNKESILKKRKETNIKKFGVDNPFKSNEIKNKIKETNIKKFGVDNPAKNKNIIEKCIKTRNKRYENGWFDSEKMKNTCLEHFGVDCSLKSKEVIKKSKETRNKRYKNGWFDSEKIKKTWIKTLGVEHNMQNKKVFEKAQKSSSACHRYKDTNIIYRGSYELDFLNKYYNIFKDIVNGPSIKYYFNNSNHVYHSDFYIPSLNLVVEIKSKGTIQLDGIDKLNSKCEACKKSYNFIMILEKDYKEFNDKFIIK